MVLLEPELLHWAPSKVSERHRDSRALIEHPNDIVPHWAGIEQSRCLVSSPEVLDAFAREDPLRPIRIVGLSWLAEEVVDPVHLHVVKSVRANMLLLPPL